LTGPSIRPWVILAEGQRLRWGGDLRRHYIFSELARRTGGRVVDGWHAREFRPALLRPRGHLWTRPARVASCELLDPAALEVVQRRAVPAVLDFHDDPVIHREALGVPGSTEEMAALRDRRAANWATFHWLISQSASFTALAGLDSARTIIAPNASETTRIVPGPWPSEPSIGFVSGAAPGRGIETLVDAARLVRAEIADLRLRLWLVATGEASERYLGELRASCASESWIEIATAPYGRLSEALAAATVLAIPHPRISYWDAILPVKLFDSMAAGRPLVVTPRFETAQLVDRARIGIVADGDRAEDLATALARLLGDPKLARELGARGREAAERDYDWRVVSSRLADELLAPRRYHPVVGILRGR